MSQVMNQQPFYTGTHGQISLAEAHAVHYWMEEFGVSQPELIEAVELMGPEPDKVRRYLN